MNRIDRRFEALREDGRSALIPFVTAGDPRGGDTALLMQALTRAGADIIELGVPFSDPMADGPVIQSATERALAAGTTLDDVLDAAARFRETDDDTPVVLMGYMNPLAQYGLERFADRAAAAGVDGVLTVDLPPEEAESTVAALKARDIHTIYLVAPTTTDERLRRVCELASGFVYYVSLKGVTGAGSFALEGVRDKVEAIRGFTDLPVGVGFGIKDAATAEAVAGFADAVVVGSALVNELAASTDAQAARAAAEAFLQPLRSALDAVAARAVG